MRSSRWRNASASIAAIADSATIAIGISAAYLLIAVCLRSRLLTVGCWLLGGVRSRLLAVGCWLLGRFRSRLLATGGWRGWRLAGSGWRLAGPANRQSPIAPRRCSGRP